MRHKQAFQGLANALCMGLSKGAVVVVGDKNVTGGGALVPSITPQEADECVCENYECHCGGGVLPPAKSVAGVQGRKRAFVGMRGWVKGPERR